MTRQSQHCEMGDSNKLHGTACRGIIGTIGYTKLATRGEFNQFDDKIGKIVWPHREVAGGLPAGKVHWAL